MENIFIDYVLQYGVRILSIVLAGIFLKSVLGKVKDIYGFSVVLSDYKVLPKFLIPLATIIVPAAELAVAVGFLLGGKNLFISAWIGALLQASFALIMLIRLNTIQPHGCGCFGLHSAERITISHFLQNVALCLGFIIVGLYPHVSLV